MTTDCGMPPSSPLSPKTDPGGSRRWMVLVALVAAILLIIAAGGEVVRPMAAFIRSAAEGADGPWAQATIYGLASLFTFLTVLLPLPAEASAFLNGSLFPSPIAFGLTWTMAMVGAATSYEVGRRHGRTPAHRLVGKALMDRVERLIDHAGWPTLLALRLSPVMAFTAINWASGILALSRPVFYWTTAVGLVPGTYVFTVVPHLLQSGASTAKLVGLGSAAAVGLLGVSYLRMRRTKRTEY
jgi:uncharacterized membrane protein YdjX (TVP38/TMEM64 family)